MGREYSSMSGHIRSVVTVFDDNVTHLCHISCSMMFFRTGVTVSGLFLTQRSTKVHKVNFFTVHFLILHTFVLISYISREMWRKHEEKKV